MRRPAGTWTRATPDGRGLGHRAAPGGRHRGHRGHRGDQGSAALLAMTLVAMAAVVLLLVLDLTAYLVAARRAQRAADAAALAAAALAHPQASQRGDPAAAARQVTDAWEARLDGCRCARGTRTVEVAVSTPVRALVVTKLAGRRVTATASATLVPP